MHGCTEVKGWIHNRVMELWKEKTWLPYVSNKAKSELLLDQAEPHIHPDLFNSVDGLNTCIIEIQEGFTSVGLLCDAGIIKPLKTRLIQLCQQRKVSEYTRLGGTGKIPVPGRQEVLQSLDKIWREFPTETVLNSFKKCRFTEDRDIDIGVALDML